MSTSTTPPQPHPSGPTQSPADPLLQGDSFIDPSATTSCSNSSATETPFRAPQRYTLIQPNAPNSQHTDPKHANTTETGTPSRARRKGAESASWEASSWLPPGWIVEDRVRTSGATAGTVDKYYIETASGLRFRSKIEVQHYLETGTVRKKKKATENPDADINSSESSRSRKNNYGTSTKSSNLNFDAFNVPERIEWVLIDANEDSWTPFIGGEKVPGDDRQAWDAAFTSLATISHGNRR